MKVGIPREVKDHEDRVAITPAGVHELTRSGHQVYVVCPRIGDTAPDDEESTLSAVEETAPELADGPLHGLRVEKLHGRMAPDAKDAVMRAFGAGEIDVVRAS